MKNNLRIYRVKYGWTQDELARRMEVSRQTINSIENNKYFPSLELGLKLARALECTVEDIFSLD